MGVEIKTKIEQLQTHMEDFLVKPGQDQNAEIDFEPLQKKLEEIMALQKNKDMEEKKDMDDKMPTLKFESDLTAFLADPAKWGPLQNKFARHHTLKGNPTAHAQSKSARTAEAKLNFKIAWAQLRLADIKKSKVHTKSYRKVDRNLAL